MRIVILLVLILLYGGANYYAANRLFRFLKLLGLHAHAPALAVLFFLLSAATLLSFLGRKTGFHRVLFVVGSVWMGILMYLFLFTAAADLVLLLIRAAGKPSATVKIAAEAAVLLLTAVTVVCGTVHAGRIQTARYTVGGKGTDPLKIVLISDIHIGALGIEGRLTDMVDAVNSEEPDIVCIAGDIFNNNFSSVKDPDAAAAALKQIRAKYGVYACFGNHDCGSGFRRMEQLLSDAGITLLCEDFVLIPDRCVIYGRADSSPIGNTGAVKRRGFDCGAALTCPGLPVIVLDHNPANYGEYGKEVSLVLCGHTHRGQLFPGPLITRAMYTVDYGLFKPAEDRPAVIVTSGIGYWGPPLRVGTDSELAVIELR